MFRLYLCGLVLPLVTSCGDLECVSTSDYQCTPTNQESTSKLAEEAATKTQTLEELPLQEKCLLDATRQSGCLWVPVSLGAAKLEINNHLFTDVDEAQRNLSLITEDENLSFKYPKDFTNSTATNKMNISLSGAKVNFKKTPFGGEVKANHLFVSKDSYNDYELRLYGKFDMVSLEENQPYCFVLEHKADIDVEINIPTYLDRISSFTANIYEGKCNL